MAGQKNTRPVSVSQLSTAGLLADWRKDLELLRTDEAREWALNRAFYKGDQWVFWNKVSSQVETLPVSDADKPRWKVRLTSNQILPGVQHYISQLTKNKPVIAATPDSSNYRDICAAQVAESLFEYWWQDMALRSKLQTALIYACLSQGYWKISWDAYAGKSMRLMVSPDGQMVTNDDLADAYREQLEAVASQNGIDPQKLLASVEKTIYVGDICIEPLPGENVYVDPAAKTMDEANWAVCKHAMDVDEIWSRFRKKVEPNVTPTDTNIPLAYTRNKDQKPKTLRDVYIGYFKPTAVMPRGRYVVWIEEPNEILLDQPWQYPFHDLPLVKFPGIERPDSILDEPIVSHVRPLQKELNRTLSQIVQFKDLTIRPQMIAPIGSLRQRLTDEPGAVFEYQPIQQMGPEWRPMPNLPQSTFVTLADIQQRIDKLFNRIPSQRDQLPARSDSGYQLELIQEAVADQISPIIQRLEDSLAKAGRLMILLAKQYYIEPRVMKIRGNGGAMQVKKFMNSDLEGGFSFHAETGSGLPRSRAGRQQTILNLVERNVLTPQMALKHLDLGDLKGVQNMYVADEDQAYREHDKLIRGIPINPAAIQQVMMQIQEGLVSGQIDQQQAQMAMQQAALQPTSYENSQMHLEVHGLYMKSAEFDQLPPDVQGRFAMHFDLTSQHIQQMAAQQAAMDPRVQPRVSLSAKAATSAPVMGEMLRRSGINVTDEQVAEPPLETMVYDSIDKPDMDDAANDPLTQAETLMAIQSQAQDINMKSAKAAHDMTLANHSAAMQDQAHREEQRRKNEVHQERIATERHRRTQQRKGGTK